jgi:hypothetical protein
MTLNPDVVRTRCGDIDEACGRLARFAAMPMETFVADSDAVDAACYRLLVGMEAALTLCYHVSAKHQSRSALLALGHLAHADPRLQGDRPG